jgi:membrane protease YdiL (CAAX protease family)
VEVRRLRDRALVLLAAAGALWVLIQPSRWLRDAVLHALGDPPYRGPWITFDHLFLYSTLGAATCAIVWIALAGRGLMPPLRDWFRVRPTAPVLAWGVGAGLAISGFNIAVVALLARGRGAFEGFAVQYVPPNGWDVLGNVFSNFYEEFIARGFLLLALRAAFNSTLAAVIVTSLIFGVGHDQYPLFERCVIALSAALQCVVFLRTRSLWSTWITHEVYDLILDCALKVG